MNTLQCFLVKLVLGLNLLFAANSFPHIPPIPGTTEDDVDIHPHVPTHSRRKRSAEGFPDEIDIDFVVRQKKVDFALKRNPELTGRSPIFVNKDNRLVQHSIPRNILVDQAVAYYSDRTNGSSFMVWHKHDHTTTEEQFLFFGTVLVGSRMYQIQPPEGDKGAHTVSEVPESSSGFLDVYGAESVLNLTLSKGDNQTSHHRRRRQSTVSYEVEIFFVVDFGVYTFWDGIVNASTANRNDVILNYITQFYSFVLNAIDVRYASVTGRGFTITCLYSGIYIAETVAAAPFIEDILFADDGSARRKVDGSALLYSFKDWATTNLKPNYDCDHAMLYTGYDLGYYNDAIFEDGTLGVAFLNGVCSTNNLQYSINEDRFESQLASTGAHELGHNLGSPHDGTDNACNSSSGHIMNPSGGMSLSDLTYNQRQFVFSSCTLDYFQAYVDSLGSGNCMESRSASYNLSALADYAGDLAGQVYPPDVQCEYLTGSGSYFYRPFYTDFSNICTVMTCLNATSITYRPRLAWEGTTCGNGKLCQSGECVTSSDAPTGLDETCLFGDTPGYISRSNDTCTDLVGPASQSYNCYHSYYRGYCCASCNVHKENNAGRTDCPYGDRLTGCVAESCPSYDETTRTSSCCGTCAPATTRTTSTTTTTPTTTTTTNQPGTTTATPGTTTNQPGTTTATPGTTTNQPGTTTATPGTTTNQPGTTTATPETTTTQTTTTTSTCETTTTPTGTSTSTSETKCTTTSQPVTETTCTCTSVTKTTTPSP